MELVCNDFPVLHRGHLLVTEQVAAERSRRSECANFALN